MTANRISQLKEIISLEEKRADLQTKIDALDEQIATIQNSLYNVKGKPTVASKGKSAAPGARKGRGALRGEILEALAAAGAKGAAVQDLATLLNTKPANIHSWFSTNLKKTKGLKKVGEARYALTGGLAASAAGAETTKPAAKRGRKPSAKIVPLRAQKSKAEKAPKRKAAASAKAEKAPKAAKAVKAPKGKAAAAKRAASAASKASAKTAASAPAKRGELKAQIIDTLKAAGPKGISVSDLSEKLGVKYKNLYVWFLTTGKRIPGLEKVGAAQYALS